MNDEKQDETRRGVTHAESLLSSTTTTVRRRVAPNSIAPPRPILTKEERAAIKIQSIFRGKRIRKQRTSRRLRVPAPPNVQVPVVPVRSPMSLTVRTAPPKGINPPASISTQKGKL